MVSGYGRNYGHSVRAVRSASPVLSYIITATANPTEGGTVSGAGTYEMSTTCTLTATANAGYTFTNWTENGEVVSTEAEYSFTVTGDRDLVANFEEIGGDDHTYVDLGLPSGLLWATCNVGANAPEEYGDYFAWGETQPKDVYNWDTYQYYDGSNVTKYTGSDGLTILLPEDDAATANWGDGWRMPTEEEWQELLNNTTVTWTQQNGVNGRLFTAPNGNSLFLPAAGDRWGGGLSDVGSHGVYWSSSLYTGYPIYAWRFYLLSDRFGMEYNYRYVGRSVRAVRSALPVLSYIITATANPTEGGTVSGAGTYEMGTICTLTATANTGYTFTNWTENGEVVSVQNPYTFTVTGDRDLVANFEEEIVYYTVTLTANPAEGGEVTGAGTFEEGTEVTVTATANDGYTFYRWTENGSDVSYSSSYSFVVTEDCNLVANFVAPSMNILSIGDYTGAEGETLSIDINLANENEVAGFQFDIPLNEGFTYVEGSIVKGVRCTPSHTILTQMVGDGTTLRVICYSINPPANISGNDGTIASLQISLGEAGMYELGLEGCIISSIYGFSLPCIGIGGSLTVNDAGTFDVTVAANPVEGGTVTGAGTYDYGTSVTVTATANEFYVFVNWTEGDVEVSTDASYTFTITDNHDLVANFILPGILGDANNDHIVNVADVQAVVSYLYGYYLPTFNVINADANEDGIIDIGDVQAIMLIIQNDYPDKSMGGKPVIYTIENGVLNISLTEELSAMQIKVNAPIEIANTDVFDGFTTVIDRVQGTNSYMFLAYSLEGKTVKPGKYAILNIADGTIEKMTFSTPTAATVDGIEGDPLGIGEETVTANVYPNPTNGMITVEAENMSEIVISNLMGQIVARYAEINGSSANIDMNGFEKGTYLVRIITDNSVIVKNVVKM